ncbi:hypothetical protein QBC41DRAFT_347868 [Cercophora samala]|uniref:Uncharacterized protein n=1 Tax=Cercophora samala TaxID=330535 RepID=A0AA39ZBY2_9PEZI|nr:hypothetical protein QBC41DRAFT_347868 [Cercophora samala]
MSASKPQEPSPSSFIYSSRVSSSSVVLDCITVAADSYEDDDGEILAHSCEPQPGTGGVIFNTIRWTPKSRSLTPPGPRVIELPDSDSGEQGDEHIRLLRDHKAGSVSPLSPAYPLQSQQHIPSRTSDTNCGAQLMGYDITTIEDNYPERFALSPSPPPPCPTVDPASSPASSASSATMSFCTCPPTPTPESDQSNFILEIQHICLTATQRFIRKYVSDQRSQRRHRRRERALATKRLIERGKTRSEARERESTRRSHQDKVRKISPVKSSSPPRAITPRSPRPVNAMASSLSDSDSEREILSGSTSEAFTPPEIHAPSERKIPAPRSNLSSRKPTSPFSYSWMSSQMNPNHNLPPNAADDPADLTPDLDSDLDTIMSSSPDTDFRTTLQTHGLPSGLSPRRSPPPTTPPSINNAKTLTKNITRLCSILWQRSLPLPLDQKRNVLQDMASSLDLAAVLSNPLLAQDAAANPEAAEAGAEPSHLDRFTDAAVLLCEILQDWDAAQQIQELEEEGWWWWWWRGAAST